MRASREVLRSARLESQHRLPMWFPHHPAGTTATTCRTNFAELLLLSMNTKLLVTWPKGLLASRAVRSLELVVRSTIRASCISIHPALDLR